MRHCVRAVLCLLLIAPAVPAAPDGAPPAQPPEAAATEHLSPLTADQVLQILDETVDWYRTLGAQQQSATQPSDLLLLYANRQTADKVVALAFQIARANAELLSSEVSSAQAAGGHTRTPHDLEQLQRNQAQKGAEIQNEMESVRRQLAAAPTRAKGDLTAKLQELQSELDMVKAQKNLLDTMSQFVYENDPKRAGVSALKARIDALAATVPASVAVPPGSSTQGGTVASTSATASQPSLADAVSVQELGIWDLVGQALRLSQKLVTIDSVDQRTRALKEMFRKLRAAPNEQLQKLSARSDELANEADSANGAALKSVRDQLDTLAWLFTQTSAVAIPLNQVDVLLMQYRETLDSWRAAVKRQYHQVLRTLWIRVAIVLAALAAVFAASEIARRAIVRYAREPRTRSQLLLLRKLITWILVALILSLTLITHLSSFATFAGLLTAGLAVAMQSVLVSVVGYFILIGKYGVRVGDRVQIGNVEGEVIDLGLIRMHLLELTSAGPLGPTGRVVAFPNSVVFQASGGLFRQIPGVNFTWHELSLSLPAGGDYFALKDRLLAAVTDVVSEYRDEIARQARAIQQTTFAAAVGEVSPQVQLQFTAAGVEAKVRYPVPLDRAVEVDERVSQKLHDVVQRGGTGKAT